MTEYIKVHKYFRYSKTGFGKIDREREDNSRTNPLHPFRLTQEQADRYGKCHEESKKKARQTGGRVYCSVGGQHSVVVKNKKVWDYVLGIAQMPISEYEQLVPMRFEIVR